MRDFNNYLIISKEDRNWGLYLIVAGKQQVLPHKNYPDEEHPTGYYFTWEQGRILDEYQLIFITEGEGIFKTKEGSHPITKGDVIFIRPNEWHTYKPIKETGWTEYYIGFDGNWTSDIIKQPLLDKTKVISIPSSIVKISELFNQLAGMVKKQELGFQKIASGIIIQLIGIIINESKREKDTFEKSEKLIELARLQMQTHLNTEIDFKDFCSKHSVSYSYFRKAFKEYMGFAPLQYHLHLKMLRAKELLITNQKPVKEVAYELGFSSIYYFSRLFKDKIGVNPSEVKNVGGKA